MTRLDKALRSGFLSSLVSIKTESSNTLHFIAPFLRNDLQESLRRDILLCLILVIRVCIILCLICVLIGTWDASLICSRIGGVLVIHEGSKHWVCHTSSTCCWLNMLATTCSNTLNAVHVVRGGSLSAICGLSLSSSSIILAKVIVSGELGDASLVSHLWSYFSCI